MSWMGDSALPRHHICCSRTIASHFVPNITMGAPILTCVKKGVPDIFMDCHMMVAEPEKVNIMSIATQPEDQLMYIVGR